MSKGKEIIPKIKKTLRAFALEERGSISKHKIATLGSFLSTISILNLLPDVSATHSNSFNVSWDSGISKIVISHGHHGSHASHASHSSCHSSHNSCHSSHASHGSCHNDHVSHDNCHNDHLDHVSHASHYSGCGYDEGKHSSHTSCNWAPCGDPGYCI